LTLCGAGAVAFAIFSVNSSAAFQGFSRFITMLVERAGFNQLWPVTGRAVGITDRRFSPLSYADLCTIKDAIRDGIGVAYKLQTYR
jgi:hypothetical protein